MEKADGTVSEPRSVFERLPADELTLVQSDTNAASRLIANATMHAINEPHELRIVRGELLGTR